MQNCHLSEEILDKRWRGTTLSVSWTLFSQYPKTKEQLRPLYATEVGHISRGRDSGAKVLMALANML